MNDATILELSKALVVLKSISSQLTMYGREWYVWNEDGSHKETVFSLSYDEENEAFYILEEYVEQSLNVLREIAQELEFNILEHERLIPVCRVDDTLYFNL